MNQEYINPLKLKRERKPE